MRRHVQTWPKRERVMMRHKLVGLLLIVAVLLMSVNGVSAQSSINSTQGSTSDRERLISKMELAVQEVIKSREYIKELEKNLTATDAEVALLEKQAGVTQAELDAKKTEATELRASIEALKTANAERVKEIGKMQKKINKLEGQVRFWRKLALTAGAILAVGAAAVVMRN